MDDENSDTLSSSGGNTDIYEPMIPPTLEEVNDTTYQLKNNKAVCENLVCC